MTGPAGLIARVSSALEAATARPGDDEFVGHLKALFVAAQLLVAVPVSAVYAATFVAVGEVPGALVVVANGATSLVAGLLVVARPERFRASLTIQAIGILGLAVLRPLALGAYPNHATGTLWGLLAPMSFMLLRPVEALGWFLAFIGGVVAVVLLTPALHPVSSLPDPVASILTIADLAMAAAIALGVISLALLQRRTLQARADALLDAILPRPVARRLQARPGVVADRHESVSILFADVIGFTPLSATLAPEELVGMLDEVFSDFDAIVEAAGLEKIKTVGDTYMVASGIPQARQDHAEALVGAALAMQAIVAERRYRGHRLAFRYGINSGPVVAGVIGRRKFAYDLWGDTVNVASRMESHGSDGVVQITRATRDLLGDRFVLEPLGTIEVKGRGPMETWRVNAPSSPHR